MNTLTLPPFVPSRVVEQLYLERDALRGKYTKPVLPEASLHRKQTSSDNCQRRVDRIAPHGAFFGFSGETRVSDRGALMAYLPATGEHWPWYLEFARSGEWRIVRAIGVTTRELAGFEESSKAEVRV